MNRRLRTLLCILVLMFVAMPGAWAQSISLDEAQRQGYVGERLDGYIGAVRDAPGVQSLVDQINLQRRQLYRNVARDNGIPLATVEKLAGKKAIDRASSGAIVQSSNGAWVRKP